MSAGDPFAGSNTGAELTRLPAAELAAKIHSREVSAVEVAQAHLDRIAAVDGAVHAFLHVAGDAALASAALVDAALDAGTPPASPLAGVPLALKDVFTTLDMPTTCGSRLLENWRPPYDATVTRRLREAGVVILGKTNMDEFAMGSSTENSAYQVTRNPWDLDRIPGGSGSRFRGAAGDRHRHRRLDPSAQRGDRHRRGQTHLRRCLALRPGGVLLEPGPGWAGGSHRARRRAAARGDRRA
jgi:amidase